MKTPIVDFVKHYIDQQTVRLHMPGHKGEGPLGIEAADITEFDGADVLYDPKGILADSQANASALFGTGKTLYSCEGSSLSIRAMLYLALLAGDFRSRTVWAARNAHRVLMSAAALLDCDIRWLYPQTEEGLLSCTVTAAQLEAELCAAQELPCAVYITSPDYLGHTADVAGLAAVCRRHGVLLLCDNAHGAYRRFLPDDAHPITLGAHLCCDSAHKTLPVLTGGGYLHIHRDAPAALAENAERAMALFASTSPSYLILQSLDAANAYLADGYRQALAHCAKALAAAKADLRAHGFEIIGEEELKLTLAPKSFGYTGEQVAAYLKEHNMMCEFYDADYVVCMITPSMGDEALRKITAVLCALPQRQAVSACLPPCRPARRRMSARQALFSKAQTIPVSQAIGRVLACETVSCPPAIPIVTCGEEIDRQAAELFTYYGMTEVTVVAEN